PVDRQVHLPERAAPLSRPDQQGGGGVVGDRGFPFVRGLLRPHSAGLVGELRAGLAEARRPLQRALPADVAFLADVLGGLLQGPQDTALADRALPEWSGRRVSSGAVTAAYGSAGTRSPQARTGSPRPRSRQPPSLTRS